MDSTLWTHVTYLAVSGGLTVWVARTLSKNGAVFLEDVFEGHAALARSVNRLLVVGFYLVNSGFVCLNLRAGLRIRDSSHAVEVLARRVGVVLLVLGALHFLNLYVFHRIRRQAELRRLPLALRPDDLLPPAVLAPGR